MKNYALATLDMAGTTIQDPGIVEQCFAQACEENQIMLSPEKNKAIQGLKKRHVFQLVLTEQLGADHPELNSRAEQGFNSFRRILENYYRENDILLTDGCLETLTYFKRNGIKIALTTGFYREVTNIILQKIGWFDSLNEQYLGSDEGIIQASICSDDVENGRPAPDMIQRAMKIFNVQDPQQVICVGDTPSDLQSGKNAHCGLTVGLINGTHSLEQLQPYDNDVLLGSLGELPAYMESNS